jgi:NAD dependent epimerase/dehydratase family enzyme
MRVMILGGTGLIGAALAERLDTSGDPVVRIARRCWNGYTSILRALGNPRAGCPT